VSNLKLALAQLPIREDRGQTMAEYAVVLAVITLAVVVALVSFSGQITDAIGNVGSQL
jgi:Flp pilus assembly pilin Flp